LTKQRKHYQGKSTIDIGYSKISETIAASGSFVGNRSEFPKAGGLKGFNDKNALFADSGIGMV
jgi:hypothetical protein